MRLNAASYGIARLSLASPDETPRDKARIVMIQIPKTIKTALLRAGYKILDARKTTHIRLVLESRSGRMSVITVSGSPANMDDEAKFAVSRARRSFNRKRANKLKASE